MYVYAYIYIYIYTHTHASTYTSFIYIHIYIYVYIHTHKHIHIHIHIHVHLNHLSLCISSDCFISGTQYVTEFIERKRKPKGIRKCQLKLKNFIVEITTISYQ